MYWITNSSFGFVMISAILISIFSTLTPYLVKIAVDDYLSVGKYEDFILLLALMIANLVLTVVFMFLFKLLCKLIF